MLYIGQGRDNPLHSPPSHRRYTKGRKSKMENLIVAIALYIVVVAIANRPKSTVTDPAAPVQYFPTVKLEPETATAQPVTIVEPLPVATFKAIEKPVKTAPKSPTNNLNSLSIRELKKMASVAKIKRYSVLKKSELILALS